MRKLTMRLATNEEGSQVGQLVDPEGTNYPGCKWSDIYPYWLVFAWEDTPDKVIACAQVITSKPIGYIDYLAFDEAVLPMQRAHIIKQLQTNAQLMMYANGVFVARVAIPVEDKAWKKVIKRHWGQHDYYANVYVMRVQ